MFYTRVKNIIEKSIKKKKDEKNMQKHIQKLAKAKPYIV